MKRCYTCDQEKPLEEFSKNVSRKDGLNSKCKTCHSEYRKIHYEKNKQKYIDKAKILNDAFIVWWKNYKAQFVCAKCGESHPACIHFHHHNDDKEASVADLVRNKCKDRVIQEISKCTPLCANCHAKVHWKE